MRMIKFISFFFITLFIIVSCTTETASVKTAKPVPSVSEIYFNSDNSEAETFYFSDILKKNNTINYTAYSGTLFTDSTDIQDSDIIGMSMTDEKTLLTSDRKGNIRIYKKNGGNWKLTDSLHLDTEETVSFDAFSADSSYICLYSGKTDSVYFFSYKEYPDFILKLLSDRIPFNREITDIDIETGYIYMLDTENRVSIIDYIKKKYETEFSLKSRTSLRSLSVIQDTDKSSLAALSPGSSEVYIFPLSDQYLMIKEKGYIKKAGITSFNYGTHVLVSDKGKILYALESRLIELSDFTKGEITLTGKLKSEYPVDDGPEFLIVSEAAK